MTTTAWIILGVVGFIVLLAIIFTIWAVSTYNSFIKMKNNIEEAFSTIR